VHGAFVREDGFDLPECERTQPAASKGPAPPTGARLLYADAAGRPCSPEDAFTWTWENAPHWFYSRVWPVTDITNNFT
jgi:hypothetical protein